MDTTTHVNGRPAIGQPGRAATEMRHRPVRDRRDARPDVALTELEDADLHVLGVSARGVQHCLRGKPRQDAAGVLLVDDVLYTVVCDGVGEFARSHVAADHVVDVVLGSLTDGIDVDTALKQANEDLDALARDGDGPLATTVLVAATRSGADGWLTVELWWVGDPYAWALLDGGWTVLNPAPESTEPYYSTATRALPAADLPVGRRSLSVRADAVFLMTDGVGAPLAHIDDVRTCLAAWWTDRPSIFDFASQVSFARKSHMDDRTVVGVWQARPVLSKDEDG